MFDQLGISKWEGRDWWQIVHADLALIRDVELYLWLKSCVVVIQKIVTV